MTDTARVLLTAATLSATALGLFAWRLSQTDATGPARLIGELRLAQWAALILAACGAASAGLAVGAEGLPTSAVDATLGVAFIVLAGVLLLREPREGLVLVAAAFVLHALTAIGHRPGWLSPDLAPRWFRIGSAIYDVYIAAVCYWARRR